MFRLCRKQPVSTFKLSQSKLSWKRTTSYSSHFKTKILADIINLKLHIPWRFTLKITTYSRRRWVLVWCSVSEKGSNLVYRYWTDFFPAIYSHLQLMNSQIMRVPTSLDYVELLLNIYLTMQIPTIHIKYVLWIMRKESP